MSPNALLRAGGAAALVLQALGCRAGVDDGARRPATAERACQELRVAPGPEPGAAPGRVTWPLTDRQSAVLRSLWRPMHTLLGLHGRAPMVLSTTPPASGRWVRLWILEGEGGPANRLIELVESDARRELHAFAWFSSENPRVDEERRRGCGAMVCDGRTESCVLAPSACLADRIPATATADTPAPTTTLEGPWVLVEQLDPSGYRIGPYDELFPGASVSAAELRALAVGGAGPDCGSAGPG